MEIWLDALLEDVTIDIWFRSCSLRGCQSRLKLDVLLTESIENGSLPFD